MKKGGSISSVAIGSVTSKNASIKSKKWNVLSIGI
jgi:hypothetical protein